MSIENPVSSIQYRESSYLRAYKALHLSRALYKSALFMQNKPNFIKDQMNVSIYYTNEYKNFIPLAGYKNKPNSNPIKPNTNPIPESPKMNETLFATKVYENITTFRLEQNKANSNPNKPNFFKGQNELKTTCRKVRPHPSKLRMENNSLPWDQKGYNLPINPAFPAYRSNGSKCKVTDISLSSERINK